MAERPNDLTPKNAIENAGETKLVIILSIIIIESWKGDKT